MGVATAKGSERATRTELPQVGEPWLDQDRFLGGLRSSGPFLLGSRRRAFLKSTRNDRAQIGSVDDLFSVTVLF